MNKTQAGITVILAFFNLLFQRPIMSFFKNILFSGGLAAMFVLLTAAATRLATGNSMKWVILKECMVRVNGSTNVNRFVCIVPRYTNSDTISCYINNSGAAVMTGRIAIPVQHFDCANPMMTSDLRKTLRAKDFPVFYIHFLSLSKYPQLREEEEVINGTVNIELAGVTRKITVNYRISMDNQKVIRLIGTQAIHFSDFDMIPPRKLGGMIRANDRLDVEFTINCRLIAP